MITIPLPGRLIRDADAWQPDGPTTAHQIFHHGNAFAARWPRRFRCSVVTQYRVAWVAWSTVSQCICFLRKWEHFPLAHVGRHREALDSAWLELQQQTWIWHVLLQRFSGLAVTAGFCVTILCSNLLSKKGKAASQVSYWFLLVFTGKRWTKSPVQPVSLGAILEETCPLRIGKWTPAWLQDDIFQKDKDFLPMIPVIRDFAHQESSHISKVPQLHKDVNFQCKA